MAGSSSASTRHAEARTAGHKIYGAVNGQQALPVNVSHVEGNSTIVIEEPVGISPIRRTFLLVVLFDLICTVVLWIIYTQIKPGNHTEKDAFKDQVVNYTFGTSLFDVVWVAAFRFAILTLAYALFRSGKPWWVAITTAATCAFIVAKVVVYGFETNNSSLTDNKDSNHTSLVILDFIVILSSLVIAWVETWLLDLKVLPREKRDRERWIASQREANETSPLLSGYVRRNETEESYYSPAESDSEDSDDSRPFHSANHSRSHSVTSLNSAEYEYQKKGKEALSIAWDLVNLPDWSKNGGTDEVNGIVYSHPSEYGKLFKLVAELEVGALTLFNDLIENPSDMPNWNPTVLECRTLRVINDDTEISYNVAAEGAGGMVSSRDFVYVRHWEQKDGWYVSATTSVDFPEMPAQSKYVRGVQKPALLRLKDLPDGRTKLEWILNTDLKGWLPQYLIDQALSGVLLSYLENLKIHCQSLA